MDWNKTLIGACGGFCVALIRLMHSSFYIGESGIVMLGGFLTAFGFIVLSVIFTNHIDDDKRGRLFMQALLAPTFLIALLQYPTVAPYRGVASGPKDVPKISSMLSVYSASVGLSSISVAHALEPPKEQGPRVEVITRKDFDGSIADGALLFMGRPKPQSNFIYVLGKTSDRKLALKVAADLEKLPFIKGWKVRVLNPKGSKEMYLSIGKFMSAEAILETKEIICTQMFGYMPACDPPEQKAVELLLKGKIVDGRSLVR